MTLPVSRGHRGLRMVVRQRSDTYTVTRGDGSIGDLGEKVESDSTHNADAWIFEPNQSPIETEFGDRLAGDLRALSLPSEDWEHADEIDHGGNTYQVQDPYHIPNESNKKLKVFDLQRKTN